MISTTAFLKALPWGLAAVMTGITYVMLNLYMHERDAYVAYQAEVKRIAAAKEAQVAAQKAQAEADLKQVRKDYEAKVPAIRRDAVAAYKLRHTDYGTYPLPGNAACQRVDDGTQSQQLAPDPDFIRACAEDVAKLSAFQDYCKRNHCPVKE